MRTVARDGELARAALALNEGKLAVAEPLLRDRLRRQPLDVAAIRMLAELAARMGRLDDSNSLLHRALELEPAFFGARELLARNLKHQQRPAEALSHVKQLLADEPSNPSIAVLEASLLVMIGDQEGARLTYRQVLDSFPGHAKTWMSLGHVLKTLGRTQEGVDAYRQAIARCPTVGEAWWSLANLKTVQFSPEDVRAMTSALAEASTDEDRLHLHFALAKAREDAHDYAAAFEHYAAGNGLRRKALPYSADATSEECMRVRHAFTAGLLNAGTGCAAPDPIFIIGLPRAGSTLIEQILASHSQVEGTMELPDMMAISTRLRKKCRDNSAAAYREMIAALSPDELRALGQEYLERTRIQRKTGRPLFIDKMPNNWMNVGLIRMILPNARIIDARRHPMASCFSAWKQHFARGQAFTYDLTDVGRYYCDYVELMEHFSQLMPGAIHRVEYEKMVTDTETEVRRLLAHLQLPFEPQCLDFWKNDRAVRTASSEQVRSPIFDSAIDQWRNFEPWLGPLAQALHTYI